MGRLKKLGRRGKKETTKPKRKGNERHKNIVIAENTRKRYIDQLNELDRVSGGNVIQGGAEGMKFLKTVNSDLRKGVTKQLSEISTRKVVSTCLPCEKTDERTEWNRYDEITKDMKEEENEVLPYRNIKMLDEKETGKSVNSDVLRTFEKVKERKLGNLDYYYMDTLVGKYRDNTNKMFKDITLNYKQYSLEKIETLLEIYQRQCMKHPKTDI